VANAIAGYLAYPAQLFWPVNLAVIYPFPKSFDTVATILKAVLLLAITVGCLAQLKRRPQLAVGWCWYLGTALPVIGIVQVGEQAMADRYTYLPLIGPVAALVWTAAEIFAHGRSGKIALKAAAVLIPATLLVLSARQLQYWRNTVELFSHNVAVTPGNGSAHFTLGLGYEHTGDTNRALACYHVAKELSPDDLQIRRSLASLLAQQQQFADAEAEYNAVIALEPSEYSAHLGYASLLAAQGRTEDEIAQLNEVIRLKPDVVEALNNLAWLLATCSHPDLRDGNRAVTLAQRACELTHLKKTIYIGTLGAAYAEAGNFDEAIATAQRACDLAAKNGENDLLQRNKRLLELYRKHEPARSE
jgi:tetratricopeptide (TPR) repeat protein